MFKNFSKQKTFTHKFLEIFIIHKPSLRSREVPQKNSGSVGSAVLTFIVYKQTNSQAKFIYTMNSLQILQRESQLDWRDLSTDLHGNNHSNLLIIYVNLSTWKQS